MRQFTQTGLKPVDVVVEPDGQVWVSINPPEAFTWNAYEKIEDLRAKDYDRSRGTRRNSGSRSGRPSQWGFDPGAERGNDYAQGFEFMRDDYSLTPEMLDQIRLYAAGESHRDHLRKGRRA